MPDYIIVGSQEINQGKKGDSLECPVALAFKQHGYNYVSVVADVEVSFGEFVVVLDDVEYLMGPKLYEWVETFDRGQMVLCMKLMIEGNFIEIAEYLD